jgi:hypothetical protein
MATKRDEQAQAYRAEASEIPAPAGVRTERVVLEFRWPVGLPLTPYAWDWKKLLFLNEGESVRVVDTHAEAVAESVAWEGARDAYRGRILRLTEERDAAIRERDELKARVDYLERDRKFWCLQSGTHEQAVNVLQARVAELQAASGGGEGEPVAISPAERDGLQVIVDGVVRHGNGFVVVPGSDSLRAVESVLARHTTAPPQPRGWLTEEERTTLTGVVGLLRDIAKVSGRHTADRCELTAVAINALLARSSPPEVVLRSWTETNYANRVMSAEEVIAALAAAGVAVKEVGRD